MVRKTLKIILYIIGSILVLLIGVIIYINTPPGQNFVRGKLVSYLNHKLKTEVEIGHLGFGLPKYIVLNNVLFLDQSRDTLLAVGELKIDLNMLKLIHKNVDVQQLLLTGVHAHVYRNIPDTNYNFTYIITAFVGNKPADTTKPKKASSPPVIDLDRVRFDDIHIRFDDYTGGMRLAVNLDHLNLRMKDLDLDKMLFHIKELTVSGLQTTYGQDTSYLPVKPPDTAKTSLQLIADNVHLESISFGYNDNINKLLYTLKLGSLQLQLNKFSLLDNLVDIKKLSVNNTAMALTMGKLSRPPAVVDTLVKKDTAEGWNVKVGDIGIAGLDFKMDNDNSPRQPSGMDYNHLYLQGIALNLSKLRYTSDSISGNLKHLTVKEQCGLQVNELRSVFDYNQQGAVLSGLYLETPNTILQNYLEVHYPSLAVLQKQMSSLQFKTGIVNSVVGIKDILLFTPAADQKELLKYKNDKFSIEAASSGYLNNIDIKHLYIAGLQNTVILLDGNIKGLPEPKNLKYDLHIANFQTSARDVSAFVPDTMLSSVRLPDRFGVVGHVSGTEKDYNMDFIMASTDGVAYLKGMLAMSGGTGKEVYDLAIRTERLNIGHILKKDSLLGTVTSRLHAKGRSFDVKTMNAAIDGTIPAAFVKGYHYHDISLSATVAAEKGTLIFNSVDTNLQVELTGQFDFSGKYPAAKADIQLDSIDFQALKLYKSDFRAHGIIHLDFPELNPDYPRGEFTWWKPIINANGIRYYLDSMYVVSRPSADTGQNIIANLDVLQATITGKTPLSKIGAIIEDHINRHYTFQPTDSAKKSMAIAGSTSNAMPVAKKKAAKDTSTIPSDYNLSINGHIIDKPMLHGLLPGLVSFDSIHVDGNLTPRTLALNLFAPEIVYSGTTVDNARVTVRGADSAFTYKITADEISQSQIQLWYADIHGNLDQNTITTKISLSDVAHKERFAIAANLRKDGDSQIVELQQGLKLNYKTWSVAQPNRIVSSGGGIYIQNFQISDSSNEYIKASSNPAQVNAPIKIDISNFRLANITDVISKQDTLLADGLLSGNITIGHMKPALQMNANLQIQNLMALGDTLGNLQAQVSNKDANAFDTKVALKGQGNDVALDGTYYLQANNGNDFNFNLDVNALALRSFQALAMNQIKKSSGYVRGKLQLQGTPTAPVITGELHTDNLITTISQLNATFKMPAEKITFTSGQVALNNFTVHDSADNKAIFSGTVNIADLTNMQMALKVDAKDWRALHSTAKDNKSFYGNLLLTANLGINGPVSAPSVNGDIKILKGTDLTVVNTASDPQLQSSKGIVKFINMRDTGRLNVLVPKKKDTAVVKHKMAAGSDLNVNINVDKDARFTMVIDQASGDFVNVKGTASINASVSPGGVFTLSGDYELNEGVYQMDYDFIKRKFLIQKGSMITFAPPTPWTPVPSWMSRPCMKPTPPLTTCWKAKARKAIRNSRPTSSKTSPLRSLFMKGQVLQPALTFDVSLPENKVYPLPADQIEMIQAKLSQVRADTSQLNKQVFALLILGRFVADNPFASGVSSSASFTAMQSVSSFIGSELNQAAGKYIKGVDFSADLATTQDYTSGSAQQRTDLNLAASKRLLNDRLKLTVGNDFELQGPQTSNSQSSYVPSDLAADYLLTADGRYTMRGYRKEYNEGVLEGYITESGVDFIVNFNYNKLSDVFKKKRKEKKDTASSK